MIITRGVVQTEVNWAHNQLEPSSGIHEGGHEDQGCEQVKQRMGNRLGGPDEIYEEKALIFTKGNPRARICSENSTKAGMSMK